MNSKQPQYFERSLSTYGTNYTFTKQDFSNDAYRPTEKYTLVGGRYERVAQSDNKREPLLWKTSDLLPNHEKQRRNICCPCSIL